MSSSSRVMRMNISAASAIRIFLSMELIGLNEFGRLDGVNGVNGLQSVREGCLLRTRAR